MLAFLGVLAMAVGYVGIFGAGIKTMLLGIGLILLQICRNQVLQQ